ncbi:cellulase Cel9A precursor [Neocallimastix californiae]|uniref:Endoglucanase n=1 Tax=Neocallimastix californiae TaxID=1754190 RepID=A0A1Y2DM44_9FUNG|nr:cellulase Cel9A precursor [Neocallimastix californiae]|eukprot:ORY60330.1 cellulase Cel9A precursor [Neocallimastix californiae]
MKFQSIIAFITALAAPMAVVAKSQDYARHIELSLLFYEAQRSGKLPENNRIYWRFDSQLDAGADNGVDLTGGYYDAGDNVKFNFPQAAALTLLAWSGVDYADGYKKAGQWDYLLDAIRWGADYFMKCHTGKNELYFQVGDGKIDHSYWYPPEYTVYEHPSIKLTTSKPGSEVAADTASFLAATYIIFKDIDPTYAKKCLQHSKEIYEFADKYRGDYSKSFGNYVNDFYKNWGTIYDELAFGALWLYRATNDESYLAKYKVIADASYDSRDENAFGNCSGPISWDDKRPGGYILGAMVTGEEKYLNKAISYCDTVLTQPKTRGGLWYNDNLSKWGSNRYASNAASMLGMLANYLPKDHPKRSKYIDFVKSQTDYILGDNPAKVNYVVGAEKNSPKAVHHRGASGTYDSQDTNAKPTDHNVYTIWGALAGGPGKDDSYSDTRKNYEMNEVALDYNAAFQMNLALLVKEGLSVPDPDSVKNHDRSFPKKAETPDIRVKAEKDHIKISTGSNMVCSSWCIEFTSSDLNILQVHHSILYQSSPKFIICNERESNYLDGNGTAQDIQVVDKVKSGNINIEMEDVVVMCNGWHAPQRSHKPTYKPENGRRYQIINGGGIGQTKPLFEETECWPGFLCDNSSPSITTSPIQEPTPTPVNNDDKNCFGYSLGYKCCNNNEVIYTDDDGDWGLIGTTPEWCSIGGGKKEEEGDHDKDQEMFGDYPYCNGCESNYTDEDGDWYFINDNWCKVNEKKCNSPTCKPINGYPCCKNSSTEAIYTDDDGIWGVEDNDWCLIQNK